MTTKTTRVCKYCGSYDVRRDAWAAWDYDSQQWVLEETFDNEYCKDCEGETCIEEGV